MADQQGGDDESIEKDVSLGVSSAPGTPDPGAPKGIKNVQSASDLSLLGLAQPGPILAPKASPKSRLRGISMTMSNKVNLNRLSKAELAGSLATSPDLSRANAAPLFPGRGPCIRVRLEPPLDARGDLFKNVAITAETTAREAVRAILEGIGIDDSPSNYSLFYADARGRMQRCDGSDVIQKLKNYEELFFSLQPPPDFAVTLSTQSTTSVNTALSRESTKISMFTPDDTRSLSAFENVGSRSAALAFGTMRRGPPSAQMRSMEVLLAPQKEEVRAETVEQMVDQLANTGDKDFQSTALLMFRLVVTPADFFRRILERFERDGMEEGRAVRGRLCNFILKWVQTWWLQDFASEQELEGLGTPPKANSVNSDDGMPQQAPQDEGEPRKMLLGFLDELDEYDLSDMETRIRGAIEDEIKKIERKKRKINKEREESAQRDEQARKALERGEKPRSEATEKASEVRGKGAIKGAKLHAMRPEGVAQQLTYVEARLMKNVTDVCLLHHVWHLRGWEHETQPLQELREWMQRVSRWVATEVCLVAESKHRVAMVTRMVSLARELARLRNYNTLASIVEGLSHPALTRMTQTFSALPPETIKLLGDMQAVCRPADGNYEQYRRVVAALHPLEEPYIPAIDGLLQDLQEQDRLPTWPGSPPDRTTFNFAKLSGLQKACRGLPCIQESQQKFYVADQVQDPEISGYLEFMPVARDEILMHYSMLLEPVQRSVNLLHCLSIISQWYDPPQVPGSVAGGSGGGVSESKVSTDAQVQASA